MHFYKQTSRLSSVLCQNYWEIIEIVEIVDIERLVLTSVIEILKV